MIFLEKLVNFQLRKPDDFFGDSFAGELRPGYGEGLVKLRGQYTPVGKSLDFASHKKNPRRLNGQRGLDIFEAESALKHVVYAAVINLGRLSGRVSDS